LPDQPGQLPERPVRDIEAWVFRKVEQSLRVIGDPAAQLWLMDEVDSEARRVRSAGAGHIITELIFLLVAINRERGNAGGELVIAKVSNPVVVRTVVLKGNAAKT